MFLIKIHRKVKGVSQSIMVNKNHIIEFKNLQIDYNRREAFLDDKNLHGFPLTGILPQINRHLPAKYRQAFLKIGTPFPVKSSSQNNRNRGGDSLLGPTK